MTNGEVRVMAGWWVVGLGGTLHFARALDRLGSVVCDNHIPATTLVTERPRRATTWDVDAAAACPECVVVVRGG